MMAWLESLAPRERLLLAMAGLLTLLVVGWFALVQPVLAARADARLRYDVSARALEAVVAGLARLPATQSAETSTPLPADEMRRRITEAAQQTGLLLTQLRSESDGSVAVVLRDVDARIVFAFLQLLSTRDGIRPTEATFSRSTETLISASFIFVGTVQ